MSSLNVLHGNPFHAIVQLTKLKSTSGPDSVVCVVLHIKPASAAANKSTGIMMTHKLWISCWNTELSVTYILIYGATPLGIIPLIDVLSSLQSGAAQ
jgi:hypothetical protein